jgi:uncharacterized protein YbjT (DUF2867 family)
VGATGNFGSRLVRKLAAAGVRPRALVRTREKAAAVEALAEPVIGDLLAPETLAPAFQGADRVFVLGQPTPQIEALERNAIEAAVAAGARRIVYLSNFTAREGSELLPMHVHGLHERLLQTLGVDWTVLRPTRFMSSVPFVWRSVVNNGLLLEPTGAGRMTFADPDEVALVAARALTEDGHEGQTYRLTSEDCYTPADLAAVLSKVLGRDIRIFDGDVDALREALIANGAPGEQAPVMAKYFGMAAAGLYVTTDTLGTLLGRRPRGFAEWLPENLPAALRAA